jgi:transcriptional regulator with XRE-family HTH domain
MEAMATTYFSLRLKQLREAAGLTQKQLGERARLTRVTVARFEAGTRFPSWMTMIDLADALGVDCTAFVDPSRRRKKK